MTKTAYAVASFGCLIVVFGNIWNGGLYAVSAVLWMTIGGMARPLTEEIEEEVEAERTREVVYGPHPAYSPSPVPTAA